MIAGKDIPTYLSTQEKHFRAWKLNNSKRRKKWQTIQKRTILIQAQKMTTHEKQY